MRREIKMVIFDLDGTLLDTKQDICNSMNYSLLKHGLPPRTVDEFNLIIGGGTRTAAERSCPEGTDETVIERVFSCYKEHYSENCLTYTSVYPGINMLIARLKMNGVLLGVLTNKTDVTARRIIDHYFPQKPFSAVLGNRGDIPIKPRPDMGLWLCRTLNLPEPQCLYLGDSDTDIYFAKNAGFLPVGAAWGYRGREELIYAGAKAVIDAPLELLDLL